MLTADDILAAADSAHEVVNVPEWGGDVCVKVMSGVDRDRWEIAATKLMDNPQNANIRASLCALTMCDESGKRLFTDQQVTALGEKSSTALDRVFNAARRVNKLTDEDIADLEKN